MSRLASSRQMPIENRTIHFFIELPRFGCADRSLEHVPSVVAMNQERAERRRSARPPATPSCELPLQRLQIEIVLEECQLAVCVELQNHHHRQPNLLAAQHDMARALDDRGAALCDQALLLPAIGACLAEEGGDLLDDGMPADMRAERYVLEAHVVGEQRRHRLDIARLERADDLLGEGFRIVTHGFSPVRWVGGTTIDSVFGASRPDAPLLDGPCGIRGASSTDRRRPSDSYDKMDSSSRSRWSSCVTALHTSPCGLTTALPFSFSA
ncbi:hypothetical protein BVI434_1700022 [Burkholderia vietnamiensis]|nr:hypothetical protein BVI434_1700022 [Burkholderia vietnamiensis]